MSTRAATRFRSQPAKIKRLEARRRATPGVFDRVLRRTDARRDERSNQLGSPRSRKPPVATRQRVALAPFVLGFPCLNFYANESPDARDKRCIKMSPNPSRKPGVRNRAEEARILGQVEREDRLMRSVALNASRDIEFSRKTIDRAISTRRFAHALPLAPYFRNNGFAARLQPC